jgi:hypothetical protein
MQPAAKEAGLIINRKKQNTWKAARIELMG